MTFPKPDHLGGAYVEVNDASTYMPDVWEYLVGKYNIKSVVDIGCGAGWNTKWFLDKGIRTIGVEGDPECFAYPQIKKEFMHKWDYTEGSFIPEEEFDLAWSSEFVEHVEEKFIPNWMATMQKCKHVCITHGEKGQHGHHHVNCNTTEYWIDKFKEYGFDCDLIETAHLRTTDVWHAPWGRRSLTLFHRDLQWTPLNNPPLSK